MVTKFESFHIKGTEVTVTSRDLTHYAKTLLLDHRHQWKRNTFLIDSQGQFRDGFQFLARNTDAELSPTKTIEQFCRRYDDRNDAVYNAKGSFMRAVLVEAARAGWIPERTGLATNIRLSRSKQESQGR